MTDKEYSGILVYAQLTSEKYIHTVFFELIDKAKELAQKLGDNTTVSAVIFTPPELISEFRESFSNMGVDKVYCFESDKFNTYSTIYYSHLITNLVKEIKPEIFLIGATNQGRDLAPRISSALATGLTADCTDLDINDKGQLAATRPTFGGELMATILCKTFPQMATVRAGVFKVNSTNNRKETEFIFPKVNIDEIEDNVKVLEFKKTIEKVINDLDTAEIIAAGGMGLKNEKGFELLKQFADKIGATVAATRAAVEAGLAKPSIQVGQTGKTLRPRLYIACGISGAIQHTIGMDKSEHIIAINTDKDAPIFDIADTGIVGDFFEIIPEYLNNN